MSDDKELRFGLWYDFRNPPQWRQPYDRLYGEILDQVVWAENNGFDDCWLSEHHFIEDGYLPSMLPAAAAIAARTKRIRIPLGVLLMPFHNPVRLAEDIAVVDAISGGRFELGVGVGYKVEEFEGFAVPFNERGGRTNEALDIIRKLLDGETLTFKGKFFEVNKVKLTPEPIQKPHPPIWVGGFTPPALRRALRRRLHRARRLAQSVRCLRRRTAQAREAHQQRSLRRRHSMANCVERSGKNLQRGCRPHHLSEQ